MASPKKEIRRFWEISSINAIQSPVRFSVLTSSYHKVWLKADFVNLHHEFDMKQGISTFVSDNDFEYILICSGTEVLFMSLPNFQLFHFFENCFESNINSSNVIPSKQAFVAASPFEIKIWQCQTFQNLFSIQNANSSLNGFLPYILRQSAVFFATGGEDNNIRIWRAKEEEFLSSSQAGILHEPYNILTDHKEFITAAVFLRKFLITSDANLTTIVWSENFVNLRILNDSYYVLHFGLLDRQLILNVVTPIEANSEAISEETSMFLVFDVSSDDFSQWRCLNEGKNTAKAMRSQVFQVLKAETGVVVLTVSENDNKVKFWNVLKTWEFAKQPTIQTSSYQQALNREPKLFGDNQFNQVVVKPKTSTQINFKGDKLAKTFITSILTIENLSPDMKRMLDVCLNLHEQ